MLTKNDLMFRQLVTLRDGARVLLRPLTQEDRQSLIDLFTPISSEDKRYFRTDANNPEVVGGWVDKLDYDKVLPIVAVIGDRIVGDATLHFNHGSKRHIAEVRIFLAKDFRHRGLGSKMLTALIDLAKRRSLHILEVEVVADQTNIIRAFQNAGFAVKCTFEEYFMLPDGDMHDLVHLILRLRSEDDQF
ncbi:MAG: N-acetyltransferase family protein [Omnitrophica WOR_2 bacterium]